MHMAIHIWHVLEDKQREYRSWADWYTPRVLAMQSEKNARMTSKAGFSQA